MHITTQVRRRRRHRRRRCHVARSGRCVAPPRPRRTACLQRLAGTDHCPCGVGLSSEREDDQDDVSSPQQVNEGVLGRLGNVKRCVLELESPVFTAHESPTYFARVSTIL